MNGRLRIVLACLVGVSMSLLMGCECLLCPAGRDAGLESRVTALERQMADIGDRPQTAVSGGRLIITRHGPQEVNKGQEYEYTIDVLNATGRRVENVEVTERIPGELQYVGADPDPDATGPPMRWTLGEMAEGAEKTLKVRVRARETGTFKSCAMADHRTPDCAMVKVVEPALALNKTAPEQVLLCDDIPMSLVVENTGTGRAENVKITDDLPDGLMTTNGEGEAVFEVGDLAAGESKTFDFVARAETTGTYQNSAVAMADGDLRADSNATQTVVRQPVLKITKEGPGKRFLGQNFSYTITVENTGDAPAEQLTVEDEVPDPAEFVSAGQGGELRIGNVVWELGTLDPGQSRELTLTLRAAGKGTARNTATASAVCADEVSASAETVLAGIPAILLEVIDLQDPIEVGDTVTYEITTTNQGSLEAENVQITVTMEEEMEYVSAEGPTEETIENRTITFAPLAVLDTKDKATWRVKIKAVNPGDIRLKVQMTSAMLKRPVEETEATHFYE